MAWTTAASLGRRALLMGSVGVALATATGCRSQTPKKLFGTTKGVMCLAVDDTHLCWVTGPEHGKLFVALRDEGTAAPKHHNLDWVRDLALFDGHVYLALDRGLLRAPIDGGSPRELTGRGEAVDRLVIHSSGVYWLERSTGVLWVQSHAGGPPRRLATGPRPTTAMAANDDHLFWTAGEAGQLLRVPLGGGPTEVLHRAAHPMTDLVVADRRLFWCTSTAVMTMPVGGGAAEVVIADQVAPASLAVSAVALCWANHRRGERGGLADVMVKPRGAGKAASVVARGAIVQALALVDRTLYWADHAARGIMGVTLVG